MTYIDLCNFDKADTPEEKHRKKVELLFKPTPSKTTKAIHPTEICFPAKNISDVLPEVMENFFKLSHEIKTPVNLHFRNLGDISRYDHHNFLSSVQVAEGFYRYFYESKRELDTEEKSLKKDVELVIDNHKECSLGTKIQNFLKWCDEKSLRRILKDLVSSSYDSKIFKEDVDKMINMIINTRNYYTHLDETKRDNILDPRQMFYIGRKLDILLSFHLIKNLGIGEGKVFDGIMRNQSYVYLCSRVKAI